VRCSRWFEHHRSVWFHSNILLDTSSSPFTVHLIVNLTWTQRSSQNAYLIFNDQIADIFDEKIDLFKDIFFSAFSSTDLIDIKNSFYLTVVDCFVIVTKNEVSKIISRISFDKTSSSNDISNKLLKTCSDTLSKLLISLFQVCVTKKYDSKVFQHVNIITLKKMRRNDYIISKAYRSIVLLNIVDKMMKSIISKKISSLAKTHRLLLEFHLRIRSDKLIETALKLRTKQIHIVWEQNTNRMIILLSLNVAEVFDTISHSRLIHNLRKRIISLWIINWVDSFMNDSSITLTINRRIIELFAISTSISQRLHIFSLLYLFYNADLLKMCYKLDINTSSLWYADDVNILTYDKNTKKNCRTLKRGHQLCEKWAHRYEFVFASIKYERIHLTRNLKKFNMTIIIDIDSSVVKSKTNI
jgi:hypothetical protein